MPDNNSDNTSENSMSASFKTRRKASMFFKKALRHDESGKGETIQKLEEEKRKLKQELNKAYSRIRELELLTTRANQQWMPSPVTPIPETSEHAEIRYTSEGVENRDDDDGNDTDEVIHDEVIHDEVIHDETNAFSVEVAAITRGSTVEGEFLDIENEIHSTAPSATTIPTGNDKKSNMQRRQHQLRQKLRKGGSSSISSRSRSTSSRSSRSRRGEDAYLDYFSRRSSPPLESITEIEAKLSYLDDEDSDSLTSELTTSVASSSMLADERSMSGGAGSLMSGRRIPLSAMKSLLRISSAESASTGVLESDSISFVGDDEPVLFGEI